MKKLCTALAVLALVVLCVVLLPTEAQAAEVVESGTCGDNLTWTLDDEGTLIIAGTGAMYNYSSRSAPWYSAEVSFKRVIIEEGVTSVGSYAFQANYGSVWLVVIPSTLSSIGRDAFMCGSRCVIINSQSIAAKATSYDAVGYLLYHTYSVLIREGISYGSYVTNGRSYSSAGEFMGTQYTVFSECPNHSYRQYDLLDRATLRCSNCYAVTDFTEKEFDVSAGQSDSVTAKIYKSGEDVVLRFSGNGSIGSSNLPWQDYRYLITCVFIDDGITSIPQDAFYYYPSLTSVTIPDSVTSIGDGAFSGCANLTTVIYCGTEEQWDNITVDSYNTYLTEAERSYHSWVEATCTIPKTCTLCGETEGIAGHQVTNGICTACSRYGTCGDGLTWTLDDEGTLVITGTGAMTDYASSASVPWYGVRKSIKNVSIEEGVTSIGTRAFSNCTELISIAVPAGVTAIGDYAFYYCSGLETIVLPKGLEAVGCNAFNACNSIKTVYHCGSQVQWSSVAISTGNESLVNAAIVHNYGNTDGPATDENLVFLGDPGLSFQDYIGMQILFKNSTASDYDNFYVVIIQETPDGDVTTTTSGVAYNASYTLFEQQIVSWSMTETVTMTLYGEKDGVVYEGASFCTSVKELAMTKIAGYYADGDMARCKALVDMLNYGAAVQTFYNHNAENLPNADLGEHAALGTAEEPAFNAENTVTGTDSIKVYANNISMQAKVEFQLMVKTADLDGKTVKATQNGTDVGIEYTPYNSYTIIRVAVSAANMREKYTIAVYDADGNAVTQVYNVSVEGYATARQTEEKNEVDIALMRYGDSIRALI